MPCDTILPPTGIYPNNARNRLLSSDIPVNNQRVRQLFLQTIKYARSGLMPLRQQELAEVKADKSGRAGDKNGLHALPSSIRAKEIAGKDLIGDIRKLCAHAVGDNQIGLGLEGRKVADDPTVKEILLF